MRTLAEIAAWWVVGFPVWMATVQTVTVSEVLVAAICALGCAIAAPWLRRANDGAWTPRWAWLGWVALMLARLPRDVWRVWRFAFTRSATEDALVQMELPTAPDDIAAARRAVALLLLSATPATVVVDSDPERNTLTLHRLDDGPSRLELAVKR